MSGHPENSSLELYLKTDDGRRLNDQGVPTIPSTLSTQGQHQFGGN